jgi:hypothetical protein
MNAQKGISQKGNAVADKNPITGEENEDMDDVKLMVLIDVAFVKNRVPAGGVQQLGELVGGLEADEGGEAIMNATGVVVCDSRTEFYAAYADVLIDTASWVMRGVR